MKSRWPLVRLDDVLTPIERPEVPIAGVIYRQLGVRLWGEGAYEREAIDGASTRYGKLSRFEADDVVVNKIWARNGSVAVVPAELAGSYGSSEFPTFIPDREAVDPRWIHWLTKTPEFWERCDEKSRGTSGKNRIRPDRFLEILIPLPSLPEQRRIVAWIENIADRLSEVQAARRQATEGLRQLLGSAFARIVATSRRMRMGDVAPLARRPVEIQSDAEYPELGIRSFGRGTFHKPSVSGFSLGTKRLFRIEPGDLLFNNVFAWEGAVAVAREADAGRFGSHRFMTCVPEKGLASAEFLKFYFLTAEGLESLGSGSPGGAGRNRTLGVEALAGIAVPVPEADRLAWFDRLLAMRDQTEALDREMWPRLDAMIPAVISQTVSGDKL